MKKTILPSLIIVLAVLFGCKPRTAAPAGQSKLVDRFQLVEAKDTMHFEVTNDNDTAVHHSDTIPNRLFFNLLDTALLNPIDYVADSTESTVYSKGRFPLTDNIEACWVDIHRSWFIHQSLLIYDKLRLGFTDRITVGEWYGGDGGQSLIGSWLLDVDGDGDKDLVIRQIDHSMTMQDDGEPLDHTYESARLLRWQDGKFSESPITDTLAYVKRFPIESSW